MDHSWNLGTMSHACISVSYRLCVLFLRVGRSAAGLTSTPSRLLALSQTRRGPYGFNQRLIAGPTGSPYANGCSHFIFLLPHKYPTIPAIVKFCGDYVATEYSGI